MSQLGIGNSLCIIGAGPIGCMMIELGRHMGSTNILVIQRSQKRLEMAKKYGADHYFLSEDPDIEKKVMDATQGEGPDVLMITCASPDAQDHSLRLARHRARVSFFGGLASNARNLSIKSNLIHYKELTVLGSHGSLPRHHQKAIKMISKGMVHTAQYITHHFPLDQILEAFHAAELREGLKVVVNP